MFWLDLHLQILGIVQKASSNTLATTELSSEVEQAHLVEWNAPLVGNLGLKVLEIRGGGLRMVNFKALYEETVLRVVFCSRVCC